MTRMEKIRDLLLEMTWIEMEEFVHSMNSFWTGPGFESEEELSAKLFTAWATDVDFGDDE